MKVLSFDVGIKNMAYCCIEYTANTKRIVAWNILNMIPEQLHCYISSCKKNVVKTCLHYNRPIHWCEKHNKYYDAILNALNVAKTVITDDILTKPSTVHVVNCKTIDTTTLRNAIMEQLDKHIAPLIKDGNVDYILIENQPGRIAGTMKQVMDTLYCWCMIRGIYDYKIVKDIHLINPGNKLKTYASSLVKIEDDRKRYEATKDLSICVVYDYLKHNDLTYLQEYLGTFAKKDDLCDSLLQGFFWIDNESVIQSKKNNKKKKKDISS